MTHELALLAALQRDISERLRPVCTDMSEDTFQEIVREIVAVKMKYGAESELSASLRLELEHLVPRSHGTGSGLSLESPTEASI